MHPIRVAAIGICLTGIGVIDSIEREEYGQAVFRLATPIALFYGFGYLRSEVRYGVMAMRNQLYLSRFSSQYL
jgi:hypothetical protein